MSTQDVFYLQQIQPKVFSSARSSSTSQTPGHLWSWRMEKQRRRRHNVSGCSGQCRSPGPENRDSVSTCEVCRWSFKKKERKSPFRLLNKPRCLIWEGDWRRDVITVAAEKGRRGVYGKIVLTVCGEVSLKWSVCSTRLLSSYWTSSLTPGNSWCLQQHSSGWKEMFVPRLAQLHWSILHT